MDQFDDDHAYQILLKAFGDTPYIQHEYWSTQRGFKIDSIWSNIEVVNNKEIIQNLSKT